jgi:hypothetical protein
LKPEEQPWTRNDWARRVWLPDALPSLIDLACLRCCVFHCHVHAILQLPLAQQQACDPDTSVDDTQCRDDSKAGAGPEQQPRSSNSSSCNGASHAELAAVSSADGGNDVRRSTSEQAGSTAAQHSTLGSQEQPLVLPPFPSLPAVLWSDGATHIAAAAPEPAAASSPAPAPALSLPSTGKAAARSPSASDSGSGSSSHGTGCGCGSPPCCRHCSEGDALEVLTARLPDIRRRLAGAHAEAVADPHPAALLTFRRV